MHLDSLPAMGREYLTALLQRKPPLTMDQPIPRLQLRVARVAIDALHLRRYCAMVGSSEELPLAYAYVLAQPAHFHLINQPGFPVRSMGLVHADNRIERLAPVDFGAALSLDVSVVSDRPRRRGREFTLRTLLSQHGRTVIEMDSGCFVRVRMPASAAAANAEGGGSAVEAPGEVIGALDFGADFGRRYARVSGDYNPIHLSRWLARRFGFRHAIAHGIGTLARIDAQLAQVDGGSSRSLSVQFKRPLELPGRVHLQRSLELTGGFVLLDSQGRELMRGTRTTG